VSGYGVIHGILGSKFDFAAVQLSPDQPSDDAAALAVRAANDLTSASHHQAAADAFAAAWSKSDQLAESLRNVKVPLESAGRAAARADGKLDGRLAASAPAASPLAAGAAVLAACATPWLQYAGGSGAVLHLLPSDIPLSLLPPLPQQSAQPPAGAAFVGARASGVLGTASVAAGAATRGAGPLTGAAPGAGASAADLLARKASVAGSVGSFGGFDGDAPVDAKTAARRAAAAAVLGGSPRLTVAAGTETPRSQLSARHAAGGAGGAASAAGIDSRRASLESVNSTAFGASAAAGGGVAALPWPPQELSRPWAPAEDEADDSDLSFGECGGSGGDAGGDAGGGSGGFGGSHRFAWGRGSASGRDEVGGSLGGVLEGDEARGSISEGAGGLAAAFDAVDSGPASSAGRRRAAAAGGGGGGDGDGSDSDESSVEADSDEEEELAYGFGLARKGPPRAAAGSAQRRGSGGKAAGAAASAAAAAGGQAITGTVPVIPPAAAAVLDFDAVFGGAGGGPATAKAAAPAPAPAASPDADLFALSFGSTPVAALKASPPAAAPAPAPAALDFDVFGAPATTPAAAPATAKRSSPAPAPAASLDDFDLFGGASAGGTARPAATAGAATVAAAGVKLAAGAEAKPPLAPRPHAAAAGASFGTAAPTGSQQLQQADGASASAPSHLGIADAASASGSSAGAGSLLGGGIDLPIKIAFAQAETITVTGKTSGPAAGAAGSESPRSVGSLSSVGSGGFTPRAGSGAGADSTLIKGTITIRMMYAGHAGTPTGPGAAAVAASASVLPPALAGIGHGALPFALSLRCPMAVTELCVAPPPGSAAASASAGSVGSGSSPSHAFAGGVAVRYLIGGPSAAGSGGDRASPSLGDGHAFALSSASTGSALSVTGSSSSSLLPAGRDLLLPLILPPRGAGAVGNAPVDVAIITYTLAPHPALVKVAASCRYTFLPMHVPRAGGASDAPLPAGSAGAGGAAPHQQSCTDVLVKAQLHPLVPAAIANPSVLVQLPPPLTLERLPAALQSHVLAPPGGAGSSGGGFAGAFDTEASAAGGVVSAPPPAYAASGQFKPATAQFAAAKAQVLWQLPVGPVLPADSAAGSVDAPLPGAAGTPGAAGLAPPAEGRLVPGRPLELKGRVAVENGVAVSATSSALISPVVPLPVQLRFALPSTTLVPLMLSAGPPLSPATGGSGGSARDGAHAAARVHVVAVYAKAASVFRGTWTP
jgi:hypothetical protein